MIFKIYKKKLNFLLQANLNFLQFLKIASYILKSDFPSTKFVLPKLK